MNSFGQAMAGYRLLIGAIMGIMVLGIIISAVVYLEGLRSDISGKRIFVGLRNAVKQPNGDVLVVEDVILRGGGFSRKSISYEVNLPVDCIALDAKEFAAFERLPESEPNAVNIKQQIQTTVYIMCDVGRDKFPAGTYFPACPEIACLVSFGKKI